MPITIDATVGGASANSFSTLVEADSFIEGRLNVSTWETDASDDTKNRALVEASRWLDRLTWIGLRADNTQALSWPRQAAINPDSPTSQYYATNELPQRVKDATMELAFQFVKAGTTDIAGLDGTRNVKSKKIDVLETEYVESHARVKGLDLYPSVKRHLGGLLVGSTFALPTVRG